MTEKTTANLLVKIAKGVEKLCVPVLADYFGRPLPNWEDKNVLTIMGVYEGLIKYKGVSEELLYQCYICNRLDELIHKKYKNNKSEYYETFVANKIEIGKTRLLEFDDTDSGEEEYMMSLKNLEIYDDNHCPSCNHNCYADNYVFPPDCCNCFRFICKKCSILNKKKFAYKCYDCSCYKGSKSNVWTNINHKLNNHYQFDQNRFSRKGTVTKEDVMLLLVKQNNKCYVCDDNVLLSFWKPYCCYQLSIDRIDNMKPHDRDNVLISCYYCNCRGHPKFDQKDKVCNAKCHIQERRDLLLREDVSKLKIIELILK